jgi:hypothetical protein
MTALPGVAEILAEIATGTLSDATRSTLTRALRAAADGRPIAQILAASARNRRDDALQALRRRFPQTSPSGAAKAMATALRRYEATGWPHDRRRGAPVEARLEFEVLSCGPAPAWRTILASLQRQGVAVANGSAPQGSMDRSA